MGLMALVMVLVMFTSTHNPPFPVAYSQPVEVAQAEHYTDLEFPPLPELKLPEYETYQLDNGMVVYLMEDHELPLVQGSALIRTGSRLESGKEAGLAEITGEVMRTGGTKQHAPDELNELLEQRAAVIETGIGTTSGSANFNVLSEDLDTVFDLFSEVIRSPAFAPQKLELAKRQQAGAIERRNDSPDDIAGREFNKLVYGASSPYARTIEYETLANISRPDVLQFYQEYFRPDRIILGVVGDFEPQRMKTLIEQAFGDWQIPPSEVSAQVPDATQENKGNIFLVDQPQLTQSSVLMGHLGGQFDNPDYPALDVLNGVLNGFGGRLFNEVRSRQGLAYSVYGLWSARYDYPGLFVAGGQTRSETTVPLIEAVLAEIKKLQTEPITSAELAYAKESILNSFVFNFQDPAQTLSRLMRYAYYDYPEDFIFQYQRAIKEVTIADVQRVAQEYLQPESIVTLVVGSNEAIEPPLSNLGTEVQTVDVSIPQPSKS